MHGTESQSSLSKIAAERARTCTHYQTLGVDRQATQADIRHAYFRLKSVYTNGNQALYSLITDDELQATLAKVEAAYEILHNQTRRAAYDRDISLIEATDIPIASVSPAVSPKADETQQLRDRPQGPVTYETITTPEGAVVIARAPGAQSHSQRIRGVALAIGRPEVRTQLADMIATVETIDGSFFKALRLAAGVSESEMQVNTKISLSFLESMENDRFDLMPQATYAKGFVKSYLRYLGVDDSRDLIEAYFQRGVPCSRQRSK
jgi:curved DNA-binding protein CbpA